MVATPLAATTRYVAPGVRHYYWCPTIANTASPTRAELNAGTDLTGQVADAKGWSSAANLVKAPDFGSRVAAKIPGEITFDDSSFTMYMSSTSSDVRSLLTRDLAGYVVNLLEGDIAGRKMDVFQVVVASVSKNQDGVDAAATLEVSFGIMTSPVVDVTVPA